MHNVTMPSIGECNELHGTSESPCIPGEIRCSSIQHESDPMKSMALTDSEVQSEDLASMICQWVPILAPSIALGATTGQEIPSGRKREALDKKS
jgi:hypothetical protein